ncbi:hypothetical protein GUJ93_ZPchr0006g42586 [Zizania palustris]|uniref:Retroviral polymerase SH3-like domain-containing protein n=1 Tax=Zizania palustris TaxID=103762 RepID=A0A8J5SWC5_ZIZPA|nr:hypothetical protein GUJ93_ZPchr0006g42586 [Zizania palustris]
MFTMNVPKFLWSEAIMTATYLINRTPSRILGWKTPYEMIFGKNEFIVPPKVFGCTCFVRDHRPLVGKLDPRAVKCIFIGYSSGQKGYKCWSPSERRTFVSMDVTFRESIPFYGEKTDLSSMFIDLDNPTGEESNLDLENEALGLKEGEQSRKLDVLVGPTPSLMDDTICVQEWRKPHQEENLQVYTRRGMRLPVMQQIDQQQPQDDDSNVRLLDHSSNIQVSSEISGEELEVVEEESNLPIAIRKGTRSKAGKPPQRYGFEDENEKDNDKNDIVNYVSYASLSPTYKSFMVSLNSVLIPKDWREAKQDPRWRQAMVEELEALEKNKTWNLVPFPEGKKVVNCKWVYTVKQNPEGKIERYKQDLWLKDIVKHMGLIMMRHLHQLQR